MRLLIGLALIALAALAGVLLVIGLGAQERSLALEERNASSLTVSWSWGGQAAAAFDVAWRARGDDATAAWRSVRKKATDRRHVIENLDAGVHYVVRIRGLDADDRPIDDLRNVFATTQSAPRLLRVTAYADAALTVGWSPPIDWTPHGWRLSWRIAGSQTPGGAVNLPADALSRRIDGLTRDADYIIRLTALNSRGGESPAQTLRATAVTPPAQPVLTDASWSDLTLRAEWDAVARATGYDIRWNSADDQTPVSAEEAVGASPAEYIAPRTGLYTVAVRARIGSGPTAVRGEWSQPLSMHVRPAPHYLRVVSFDGERARLTWPGVDTPHYDLEWGEQGETKQTATRDGRSGVLDVGPLEGGKTYEFRVRARNIQGESGWSLTTTLTPTAWPQRPPLAAYLPERGLLYALWQPAEGAEWYEFGWVNAADRAETARVRVPPTLTEGGSVAAELGREGGFEDGRWLLRVRAGPHGVWSGFGSLTLAELPPRLRLGLGMSLFGGGEFCTEAGMRELSWNIDGGVPPYTLTIDGESVAPDSEYLRVFCGLRPSDPQPCDPEPKQHQTFSAVATDSRGVAAEAELQMVVAAPPNRTITGSILPPTTASNGSASGAAVRLAWLARLDPDAGDSAVCAHELRYQSSVWDAGSWPEEWTTIDETLAAGAAEYLHSGLDPDRRYRYQVRARNNIGAGEWSRPFPRTAARPGAAVLTADTAASGSVALSWSVAPAGALRWEYRQRPAGGGWGAWTAIAGSDARTVTHTVSDLTEDARHHFQVRAVNAAGPGRASATAAAAAGLTPPSPLISLSYSDHDATGGATEPGAFALLSDAADLSSGVADYADALTAAALLVNVIGYSGGSDADLLNSIAVGDTLTWESGWRCWFAYRVTGLLSDPPAPARKLFAIELTAQDSCAGPIDTGGWTSIVRGPAPSEPSIGADGIRILPTDYPVEGGRTYRLSDYGSPGRIVIDVPAGMRLIDRGVSEDSGGTWTAFLEDEASGAVLALDFHSGEDVGRHIPPEYDTSSAARDVGALFDAIAASARRQPER